MTRGCEGRRGEGSEVMIDLPLLTVVQGVATDRPAPSAACSQKRGKGEEEKINKKEKQKIRIKKRIGEEEKKLELFIPLPLLPCSFASFHPSLLSLSFFFFCFFLLFYLTGRSLADVCLKDVAEVHLTHLCCRQSAACECLCNKH